jgi:RNA polymerase sigma factor (TIGR02999 family)
MSVASIHSQPVKVRAFVKGTCVLDTTQTARGQCKREMYRGVIVSDVSEPGEVTRIISDLGSGVPDAVNRLFNVLYDDLHRVAQSRVRNNSAGFDMSATSVLHETFERLVRLKQLPVTDRVQFFRYAATVMRTVVVDIARNQLAMRRGGDSQEVTLDTMLMGSLSMPIDENLIRLDEAMRTLATVEPRLAEVVELRYFGGLSVSETASALGVTERTIGRDWLKARALLSAMMTEDS